MKFLLKHKQIILKFNFGKYAQKIEIWCFYHGKILPPSDGKKGL